MSDLTTIASAPTMTSLELVEFINSHEGRNDLTHANFMAKVPKVLGEGGLIHFQDTYIHPQNGQKYPCYRFHKREACLMAMSYSYDLQAKVYDKMTALEAQSAKPIDPMAVLSDPVALRGLLVGYTEKVIALEAKVAEQAPKAQALDRIATADGSTCITDAAKVLQVRPKDLFSWLQAHQWIYRRPGGSGWLAYQQRIQQSYMEHKVTTVERSDGSEKVVEAVRVTRKGLARLAEAFCQQPIAA